MCLSMEPLSLSLCFSPFEPEKWENEGVKEEGEGEKEAEQGDGSGWK